MLLTTRALLNCITCCGSFVVVAWKPRVSNVRAVLRYSWSTCWYCEDTASSKPIYHRKFWINHSKFFMFLDKIRILPCCTTSIGWSSSIRALLSCIARAVPILWLSYISVKNIILILFSYQKIYKLKLLGWNNYNFK